ncbi:MAG TPA: ABC transporter permease [Chloroflexi bacterium]|nr:ABC transporter permease [Chloroflexota bacterium]
MIAYVVRRILGMIPTLVIVSIVTFIIIQLPPGDFFTTLQAQLAETGSGQDTETVKKMQERYGLDQPLHVQYLRWVSGFPRGDFGWSLEWASPVLPIVLKRMGYTILVGGLSLVFMVGVAIPIGIYSATHQYSIGDHALSFLGFLGLSLPGFLLALLWMFFGTVVLRIPVGGTISRHLADAPWNLAKILDYLNHLWPPAVVLGLASTAQLQRIMRGNLLDVLGQQYITTARAKGLKERTVITKYAVRVAINPLISVMAMEVPKIISESTVVGIVMSVPTIGPLLLRALLSQDMYLAGTFLLFMSLLLMVSNLLADIALAWADPRIVYT